MDEAHRIMNYVLAGANATRALQECDVEKAKRIITELSSELSTDHVAYLMMRISTDT